MNPDILALYTQNIAHGKKNDLRINAVYSGCLVVWVGDHHLPQDTSFDIFISYFHFIFSFHRKTHLRCISSVLLHYNCKINANIQDVYHRPNLERAVKGRYPLVFLRFVIYHICLQIHKTAINRPRLNGSHLKPGRVPALQIKTPN